MLDAFKLTKVDKPSCLILLCQRTTLLLKILAISLDVFHHQVFACKLVMVWKVIDHSAHETQLLHGL